MEDKSVLSADCRDDKGRFTLGNPGGPGRPRRETELLYLSAMRSRVALDDWGQIVDAAVGLAKGGDAKSRQWLSDYLMPPPRLELDDDRGDGVVAMSDEACNAIMDTLSLLRAENVHAEKKHSINRSVADAGEER